MNRREFFAANAALAVSQMPLGLPDYSQRGFSYTRFSGIKPSEIVDGPECKHTNWNISAQVCNSCGTTAQALVCNLHDTGEVYCGPWEPRILGGKP